MPTLDDFRKQLALDTGTGVPSSASPTLGDFRAQLEKDFAPPSPIRADAIYAATTPPPFAPSLSGLTAPGTTAAPGRAPSGTWGGTGTQAGYEAVSDMPETERKAARIASGLAGTAPPPETFTDPLSGMEMPAPPPPRPFIAPPDQFRTVEQNRPPGRREFLLSPETGRPLPPTQTPVVPDLRDPLMGARLAREISARTGMPTEDVLSKLPIPQRAQIRAALRSPASVSSPVGDDLGPDQPFADFLYHVTTGQARPVQVEAPPTVTGVEGIVSKLASEAVDRPVEVVVKPLTKQPLLQAGFEAVTAAPKYLAAGEIPALLGVAGLPAILSESRIVRGAVAGAMGMAGMGLEPRQGEPYTLSNVAKNTLRSAALGAALSAPGTVAQELVASKMAESLTEDQLAAIRWVAENPNTENAPRVLEDALFQRAGTAPLVRAANVVGQAAVGGAVAKAEGGTDEDALTQAGLFGILGIVHEIRNRPVDQWTPFMKQVDAAVKARDIRNLKPLNDQVVEGEQPPFIRELPGGSEPLKLPPYEPPPSAPIELPQRTGMRPAEEVRASVSAPAGLRPTVTRPDAAIQAQTQAANDAEDKALRQGQITDPSQIRDMALRRGLPVASLVRMSDAEVKDVLVSQEQAPEMPDFFSDIIREGGISPASQGIGRAMDEERKNFLMRAGVLTPNGTTIAKMGQRIGLLPNKLYTDLIGEKIGVGGTETALGETPVRPPVAEQGREPVGEPAAPALPVPEPVRAAPEPEKPPVSTPVETPATQVEGQAQAQPQRVGVGAEAKNPVPAPVQSVQPVPEPEPEPARAGVGLERNFHPVAEGQEGTTYTADNEPVRFRYALAEADQPITSHDTALNVNPGFPAELQPRDRKRAASETQISGIVRGFNPARVGESATAGDGAPVLGPDGVVEGGNGRMIALRHIYENPAHAAQRDAYRKFLLDNAGRFGLDRAAVEAVRQPVLVRVRTEDVPDRAKFAAKLNAPTVMGASPAERARNDARAVEGIIDLFKPDEAGNVSAFTNAEFNRKFMEAVPASERATYQTTAGQINDEGIRRVRNAVFSYLYGDPAAIARLTERSGDDQAKNVTGAMISAAGDLSRVKAKVQGGALSPELDITPHIAEAANKLSTLRDQGIPVEDYLRQVDAFDKTSDLTKNILSDVFDPYKRSGKKIAQVLKYYAESAETQGDPRQAGLFGTTSKPVTPSELLAGAITKVEGEPDAQTQVFGEQGASSGRGEGGRVSSPETPGRAPAGDQPPGPERPQQAPAPAGQPAQPVAPRRTVAGEEWEQVKIAGKAKWRKVGTNIYKDPAVFEQMSGQEPDAARERQAPYATEPEATPPLSAKDMHPDRPGIVIAGGDLIPEPEEIVPADRYDLDEDQHTDVNAARTTFKNGGKAHMVASGAGVGKTRIVLATADSYAHDTDKPVLIITKSRQVIDGSFEQDRSALNLPPLARLSTLSGRGDLPLLDTRHAPITIGTYDDLDRFWHTGPGGIRTYAMPPWGLVIFDEAHALKNVDSDRSGAARQIQADHRLYATATPMDRPDVASYFLHELTGKSQASVESLLGFETVLRKDGKMGVRPVRVKGESDQEARARILQNIITMRNDVVAKGGLIRREYPFWGNVSFVNGGDLSPADRQTQRDITNYWDMQAEGSDRGSSKALAAAFGKFRETGYWLEPRKIPYVLEQMDKDLAAGRSVVIMAEGVNEKEPLKATGKPEPGFLTEMEKALKGRGIEFAKIYGDAIKGQEVAKFQNNRVRVALATIASGGTGINLDDVHGDHPRTMYLVTLPLSGDDFEQAVGRVSRRNSKTPAEVKIVRMGSGYADARRSGVINRKLEVLRRIQAGEDPDEAGLDVMFPGMEGAGDVAREPGGIYDPNQLGLFSGPAQAGAVEAPPAGPGRSDRGPDALRLREELDQQALANLDRAAQTPSSVKVESLTTPEGRSGTVEEIARTLERKIDPVKFVDHGVWSYDDIAVVGQLARDPLVENFVVYLIDPRTNRIADARAWSSRLPSAVNVSFLKNPSEIVSWGDSLLGKGNWSVAFSHNHPTGDPIPSTEDIDLTNRAARLLEGKFWGHVVIDHGKFASIIEGGRYFLEDLPEGTVQRYGLGQAGDVVANRSDVARIGKALQAPDGAVAVLFTSASGNLRGVHFLPADMLRAGKPFTDRVRELARAHGADRVLAYGTPGLMSAAAPLVRNGTLIDYATSDASVQQGGIRPQKGMLFGETLKGSGNRVAAPPTDYDPDEIVAPDFEPERTGRDMSFYDAWHSGQGIGKLDPDAERGINLMQQMVERQRRRTRMLERQTQTLLKGLSRKEKEAIARALDTGDDNGLSRKARTTYNTLATWLEAARQDIIAEIRSMGGEVDDDWGIRGAYLPYLLPGHFLIRDTATRQVLGSAANPLLAARELKKLKAANPTLDLQVEAKPSPEPGVTRLPGPVFERLMRGIADEIGAAQGDIRAGARGVVGSLGRRQKSFGSLMERTGAAVGHSLDLKEIFDAYFNGLTRWQEYTEANPYVTKAIQNVRDKGFTALANELQRRWDTAWGEYPESSRLVDNAIQKTPALKWFYQPYALNKAASFVQSSTATLMLLNPGFHVRNSLQLFQTLYPIVSTPELYRGARSFYSKAGQDILRRHGVTASGKYSGGVARLPAMEAARDIAKYVSPLASEERNQEIAFLTMYYKARDEGYEAPFALLLPELKNMIGDRSLVSPTEVDRQARADASAAIFARIHGQMRSQFAGNPADYPGFIRGPVSKVVFQFRRFGVKELELLGDILKGHEFSDAPYEMKGLGGRPAAFAKYVLVHTILAGIQWIPLLFGGSVAARWLYNKIKGEWGEETADVAMGGLPTLLGADLSNQLAPVTTFPNPANTRLIGGVPVEVPGLDDIQKGVGQTFLGPGPNLMLQGAAEALKSAKAGETAGPVERMARFSEQRYPAFRFFAGLVRWANQDYDITTPGGMKQSENDAIQFLAHISNIKTLSESQQREEVAALVGMRAIADDLKARIINARIKGDADTGDRLTAQAQNLGIPIDPDEIDKAVEKATFRAGLTQAERQVEGVEKWQRKEARGLVQNPEILSKWDRSDRDNLRADIVDAYARRMDPRLPGPDRHAADAQYRALIRQAEGEKALIKAYDADLKADREKAGKTTGKITPTRRLWVERLHEAAKKRRNPAYREAAD